MNKYQEELQSLKSWDEVQFTKIDPRTGYNFITTAGHGYLAVPTDDINAETAKKICNYGFTGKLAYYLEEDCEYSEFLKAIKN